MRRSVHFAYVEYTTLCYRWIHVDLGRGFGIDRATSPASSSISSPQKSRLAFQAALQRHPFISHPKSVQEKDSMYLRKFDVNTKFIHIAQGLSPRDIIQKILRAQQDSTREKRRRYKAGHQFGKFKSVKRNYTLQPLG